MVHAVGHSVVLWGVSGGHLVSNPLVLEEPLNPFGCVFTPSEERTLSWQPVWSPSLVTKGAEVSIVPGHAIDKDFVGLVIYPGGKVEVTLV